MSTELPLSTLVVARAGERAAALEVGTELEALLVALHGAGRAAWPGVEVDAIDFVSYLADRVPAGIDREALGGMAAADLYLACACLRGDPGALAAFDGVLTASVGSALRRLRATPSEVSELEQILRVKLLTGDPEGDRARLGDYGGRGDLRGWLRVTSVRLAISGLREQRRGDARRDELALAMPAATSDPEMDFLRAEHRQEFKAAFEEALEGLPGRERTLLRLSFLDELNIDQIGAAFRVHRATAARWLAAARQRLLEDTRRALMQRLDADGPEVDSIIRGLDSQMHVSIRRHLADPER